MHDSSWWCQVPTSHLCQIYGASDGTCLLLHHVYCLRNYDCLKNLCSAKPFPWISAGDGAHPVHAGVFQTLVRCERYYYCIIFQFWYFLKDLVMAWDLLIHTAKRRQRNQNICDTATHSVDVDAARHGNDILLPINGFRLTENGRKIKKNQKCRGENKENKRTLGSDGNTVKRKFHLHDEDTFKYDLVEVTRELMQVCCQGRVLLSACRLF